MLLIKTRDFTQVFMDNPAEKQPQKRHSSIALGKANPKKECTEPNSLTDFLEYIAGQRNVPGSNQRVSKEIKVQQKKT